MADIMNLANCASPDTVFNVGIPLCDLAKKKIKGVILLDKGVVFTPSQRASVAAFLAELKLKVVAARGSRAYPIFDINNFEDNTGDPTTGAIGNLSTATIVTSDAVPTFRFGYNGSEARHKRMALMAGASLDVLFVDDGYAIYGTQKGDDFGGYSVLQAYVDTSKFIVGDATNQYAFRLTLGSIVEYRENSAYVVGNSTLTTVQGLIDVVMSKLSNSANVYKIKMIADGGTDLEPLHGAAIAGLTFTAIDLQTGAAFTITSIADDPALDALTVTLDSTLYTALASGDKIQLNPPSASALSAAGVKPFEFIPLVITKP
ncbi:MAG TPA: hypothetical protein VEA37_02225 [Flavobacterium sp.]|nr:hypothetical protein [Flavobacterium sp.]